VPSAQQLYSSSTANGLSPGELGRIAFFMVNDKYFFAINQKKDAEYLVLKYHYSKRIPVNIILIGSLHKAGGLFGDCGEIIAACFFSIPQAKWSESVIELIRLVRIDNIKLQLSGLISKCCKILKSKGHDLIISYADETQEHKGYIYQACSWKYHGKKISNDGLIIDNIFVPGRSCNAIYGTRSANKLKKQYPQLKIVSHYDKGKHLYWKALNKNGVKKAERLKLKNRKYPKGITK